MKVLLFNAPPRSGKNTAVDIITDQLRSAGKSVLNFSLAAPLKNCVHSLFSLPKHNVKLYDKDKKYDRFSDYSLRELYIYISEQCIKPKFGHDFWAEILRIKIEEAYEYNKNTIITVDDLGFPEELNHLGLLNDDIELQIVKILRPNHSYNNDSRKWVSPTDGLSNSITTAVIHNAGSISQFKANLITYLKQSKLL